ncbi:regulator [Vibrio paucivorans]
MKYHEMTKNYIFREFNCGIGIEQAAKLCFKSVRTVKAWDMGKPIPYECKRLMKMHKRLELSHEPEWEGFRMVAGRLELPTGSKVSPQQIITGIALLEIQSELEIKTSRKLLAYARALAQINDKNISEV